MFKKYNGFLIHISLSFLIPLFIIIIIFVNQHYFTIYKDEKFYEILLHLSCSIPMVLLSIIFFLLSKIEPHILDLPYVFVIATIIIRLLFLLFFILVHKKDKKLGIILDVVFIVINIFLGLCLLAIKIWKL
jgi:hypothetical protein